MKKRRGNPGLKGRLLGKSIEAYVVALETINHLSLKYRIETFIILLCNAWELLLKAKLLEESGGNRRTIFRSENKKMLDTTISLQVAVRKVYTREAEPVRLNIERLLDMRNKCTHLVLSNVSPTIMELFQASVINYYNLLYSWFGENLSDKVPLGMMTLVFPIQAKDFDYTLPQLRREIGADSANFLMSLNAEIRRDRETVGFASSYCHNINYNVALTRGKSGGDIRLTTNPNSENLVGIIDRIKDPDEKYPYNQASVIAQVRARLSLDTSFNKHDVQAISQIFNVAQNPEYYYRGKHANVGQYSQAFIDFIINESVQTGDFFSQTRRQYSVYRKGLRPSS